MKMNANKSTGEIAPQVELPQVQERHGFRRTVCDCAYCTAPCRHVPGGLDPADLDRLCPKGQDLFAWAEEHLRALTNHPYPTLVPVRHPEGHCHWLFEGKCAVHENAPFGCAFFDAHLSPDEVSQRYAATIQARLEDAAKGGMYFLLWKYLCRKGLIGKPADRAALAEDVQSIRQKVRADCGLT